SPGPMLFHDFMELALYHPDFGYYEQDRKVVGREGDFYTSVSVGPLFGQLLAAQIAEWITEDGTNGESSIIECGAHDGRLAADILDHLKLHRRPEYERIRYILIEPSEKRRGWQAKTLKDHESHVTWHRDWEAIPTESINGVILSNELLDALPVHRIGWDAKDRCWFSWAVSWNGNDFVWTQIRGLSPEILASKAGKFLTAIPAALQEILPDGFTTEVGAAAEKWWHQAASRLKTGRLMTLDYGLEEHQFLEPGRANGTLRSYSHHRVGGDLLQNPGSCDITAHINFSTLQRIGEQSGLTTRCYLTQAQFLAGAATRINARPGLFPEWTSARVRQFQTLTHPEHLGRSFRVLVQQRD
ncbi:MAG TPA: SAM-dependent methyltransferase, partial [Roseimicrobium sp.]|nr:SAM-dependent methyltransferase [Roseimicrobium sp.]